MKLVILPEEGEGQKTVFHMLYMSSVSLVQNLNPISTTSNFPDCPILLVKFKLNFNYTLLTPAKPSAQLLSLNSA